MTLGQLFAELVIANLQLQDAMESDADIQAVVKPLGVIVAIANVAAEKGIINKTDLENVINEEVASLNRRV